MKYSKEWQDYIDSLNDCCQAIYKTALHTNACALYTNAVVEDVNKVVKGMDKIILELEKERDYYHQYGEEASLAILVRPGGI